MLKSTSNRQEPFVYGSLGGEDVPLVPGVPRVVTQMPVAPPVNAQADTRRDYELAMQIGNKGALNAFLAQYPDGFYASLAKLQLEKLAAEENRAAAAEKARVTEAERARLASEGARKDTLAKAEAEAKAAEQARIAAEKANQLAQQQAADAERKRQEQQLAATDNPRAATSPAASPQQGPQVAALTPASQPADLTKSVQLELRRVGCLTEDADGDWGSASRRSMSQFNRYAGTRLDTQAASADALQAIKLKQARVCPLVCQHGYKSDGDRCTRIVCAEGSFVNDDNECEKRRDKKPVVRRDTSDDEEAPSRRRARATPEPGMPMPPPNVGVGVGIGVGGGGLGVGIGVAPSIAPPRPQAQARPKPSSGQIYCDAYLCRPVRQGCRLEYRGGGGPANNASVEVCN